MLPDCPRDTITVHARGKHRPKSLFYDGRPRYHAQPHAVIEHRVASAGEHHAASVDADHALKYSIISRLVASSIYTQCAGCRPILEPALVAAGAEPERLIGPVVPRQPPEAFNNAAFEHVAPHAVELRERGLDVGGGELRNVAIDKLFAPLLACLCIDEGAQTRFGPQVVPAARVNHADDGGFCLVAFRVVSGNGWSATTRITVVEDEPGKAEVRRLGDLFGLGQQVERAPDAFDDCGALVGEIGDADAFDKVGGYPCDVPEKGERPPPGSAGWVTRETSRKKVESPGAGPAYAVGVRAVSWRRNARARACEQPRCTRMSATVGRTRPAAMSRASCMTASSANPVRGNAAMSASGGT